MNPNLARAIAALQLAAESIDAIKNGIDPKSDGGLPRMVAGHASCCVLQAQRQLDRLNRQYGDVLGADVLGVDVLDGQEAQQT